MTIYISFVCKHINIIEKTKASKNSQSVYENLKKLKNSFFLLERVQGPILYSKWIETLKNRLKAHSERFQYY